MYSWSGLTTASAPREQRVHHTTVDANGVIHDLDVVNDKGTRAVGIVIRSLFDKMRTSCG